jgi:SEC-C motif-containing protein
MPTDTYRQVRGEHLEALVRVTKFMYPEALDIIGFATESGSDALYRSEDLIYLDARNWSAEEQEHAGQLRKDFNFLTNTTVTRTKDYDYPIDVPNTKLQSADHLPLGKNPRNKPCRCRSGKKYKKCHGA